MKLAYLFIFVATTFILVGCQKEEQKRETTTKLAEGDAIRIIVSPDFQIMAAKKDGKTSIVIFRNKVDVIAVDATGPTNMLSLQTTFVDEAHRYIVIDSDTDGIPDIRLVSDSKGKLVRTELFIDGRFEKAVKKDHKWFVGNYELERSERRWVLKNKVN